MILPHNPVSIIQSCWIGYVSVKNQNIKGIYDRGLSELRNKKSGNHIDPRHAH